MLVELNYLKPLGNPKGSEHKYFSTRTLLKLADDEKWLSDATRTLSKYWAEQNGRRKNKRLSRIQDRNRQRTSTAMKLENPPNGS
jgi:hypothetical protein